MRRKIGIVVMALFGFVIPDARAAELKLLAATAMKSAFVELLPQFEQVTGHRVTVEYGTTAKFRSRIEGFEPFDVAVIVQAVTEELVRSGRLLQEPRPVIGITVATLVYKSDAPKPDIATPEALKSTLLSAAKISLSDPALGGTSSIYFINVVKRLGLENAITGKLIITQAGAGATPVVGIGAVRRRPDDGDCWRTWHQWRTNLPVRSGEHDDTRGVGFQYIDPA